MPIPAQPDGVVRVSAKEMVLDAVRDWIVTGVLQPGERILDTKLAEYFSVSRTPAREALQALADQGLVEVVPSCGTRVAGIDWEDVRKAYELLAELEAIAARMAFPFLGEEDAAALEEINKTFAQAVEEGSAQDQQRADAAFHGYIVEKADNPYLEQYIQNLVVRTLRIENLYFITKLQGKTSIAQHTEIIQALRARDLPGMAQMLRENWLSSYRKVQENL